MQQGPAYLAGVAGYGFGGVHLPHADNAHQVFGRLDAYEVTFLPGVNFFGHGEQYVRFFVAALYLLYGRLKFEKGGAFGQHGPKIDFCLCSLKLARCVGKNFQLKRGGQNLGERASQPLVAVPFLNVEVKYFVLSLRGFKHAADHTRALGLVPDALHPAFDHDERDAERHKQ